MKRLLITVLAVFYLGVSSGATVHFHYCMGELIEWGLSNNDSEKANECSNCGMKKDVSDDCCKNQKQEYKLKDSPKSSLSTFQPVIFALTPVSYPDFTPILASSPTDLIPESNAPPRTLKTAVFIRNCNFRI